jgi:hypothetical protein
MSIPAALTSVAYALVRAGSTGTIDLSFLSGVLLADGSVSLTGDLDLDSNKIVNLSTPTDDTDAATKAYVDSAVSGVSVPSTETPVDITASGTATAGLFTTNFVSSASGAVAVTLPAAAAGKVVKLVVTDATNAITIVAGAGDSLSANVPTQLYMVDEGVKLIAKDSTTWYVGV